MITGSCYVLQLNKDCFSYPLRLKTPLLCCFVKKKRFIIIFRMYFKEEKQLQLEADTSKLAMKKDADELALLAAVNDEWNAKTAQLRYYSEIYTTALKFISIVTVTKHTHISLTFETNTVFFHISYHLNIKYYH